MDWAPVVEVVAVAGVGWGLSRFRRRTLVLVGLIGCMGAAVLFAPAPRIKSYSQHPPPVMRAAVYDGSLPHGVRVDMVPRPSALPSDHVLVRVHAAALNPVNYKLRPTRIPFLRWWCEGVATDFAGEVVEFSEGPRSESCSRFEVGSAIFGLTGLGALQEYTVVNCRRIAKKPKTWSYQEAAGLGVAAITSYDGLVARHPVNKGERVVIIGASGGCGAMGVMIAKARGAHVTGICSGKNSEWVKGLGADEVIDYRGEGFADWKPTIPFDIVYDTVTSPDAVDPNYEPQARPWLRNTTSSPYVAINAGSLVDWPRMVIGEYILGINLQRPNYYLFGMSVAPEKLDQISQWCDDGFIRPIVDRVYSLDQTGVLEAFDRQYSRRARGKVTLEVVKEAKVTH